MAISRLSLVSNPRSTCAIAPRPISSSTWVRLPQSAPSPGAGGMLARRARAVLSARGALSVAACFPLRSLLSDIDSYGQRYDGAALSLAGTELTLLEKRADEADRYVNAWLKCVYLRDRIGQTFEGLITTVVEFGAFVQLTAIGVDGLLHIDNLRDDEYVMEPGGRAWTGRATKRRLALGARLHVIVTSVNPIEGLVDLSLVTVDAPGKIGLQKSPHRTGKPRGKSRS